MLLLLLYRRDQYQIWLYGSVTLRGLQKNDETQAVQEVKLHARVAPETEKQVMTSHSDWVRYDASVYQLENRFYKYILP